MFIYVGLFVHSAVEFNVFMLKKCFYVLRRPTLCFIYSSLFVKKNDSIEKIKKNVTKLQKNKLRNLNKYTT